MKAMLSFLATASLVCGCASEWSRTKVQVNIHRPEGMQNRPTCVYLDNRPAFLNTTDPQVVAFLFRGTHIVRVEMEGGKASTQRVKLASGEGERVFDIWLQ